MKTCKSCGAEKPLDQFHKDRSKADGLNFYCKPCMIAKQKDYAARPPRRKDPEGQKTCSTCKTLKPVSEYFAQAGRYDGLRRDCKTCAGARHSDWRLKNLDKAAANSRKWRVDNAERFKDHGIKANYGLPLGTYDKMFAEQDGKCAICGTARPRGRGRRFHVDHCHDTGAVRGLLCSGCNTGLGHFEDSVDRLHSAVSYLEKHRA